MSLHLGKTGLCLMALALVGGAPATAAAPGSRAIPSVGLGGNRFQQVAITTADLLRAVVFYRDTLGLKLMFETNGMAFFDVGGTRLMVARDPKRQAGVPTSILYFDAPAFSTSLQRLRAAGVPLEGSVETVQRTPGGGLRLQQFRDPDGNALAIMGMVKP